MTDPRASARRTATLVAVPLALLAGVLAFAALGGFDRSPASPAPTPAAEASSLIIIVEQPLRGRPATVCRALMSQLPQSVGTATRSSTGNSARTVTYGDPPIYVRCGDPQYTAPTVPSADQDEGYYILSNVCWYATKSHDGSTWSTMDREIPVTVQVPSAYDSPGQRVIAFSDAILATVPTVPEIPAGCR